MVGCASIPPWAKNLEFCRNGMCDPIGSGARILWTCKSEYLHERRSAKLDQSNITHNHRHQTKHCYETIRFIASPGR